MMDFEVSVEYRQNAVEHTFLELPDHVSVGVIRECRVVGLSLPRLKMRFSVIHCHDALTFQNFHPEKGISVLLDPVF